MLHRAWSKKIEKIPEVIKVGQCIGNTHLKTGSQRSCLYTWGKTDQEGNLPPNVFIASDL